MRHFVFVLLLIGSVSADAAKRRGTQPCGRGISDFADPVMRTWFSPSLKLAFVKTRYTFGRIVHLGEIPESYSPSGEIPNLVVQAAFSADDKWLWVQQGYESVFNLQTKERLGIEGDNATAAQFSPDGKYLYRLVHGIIRVYEPDRPQGPKPRLLSGISEMGNSGEVKAFTVATNGDVWFVDGSVVCKWDAESSRITTMLTGFSKTRMIRVSPNRLVFGTVSSEGDIGRLNLFDDLGTSYTSEKPLVQSFSLSVRGHIAIVYPDSLSIYDPATMTEKVLLLEAMTSFEPQFSDDGNLLVVKTADAIKLLSIRDHRGKLREVPVTLINYKGAADNAIYDAGALRISTPTGLFCIPVQAP